MYQVCRPRVAGGKTTQTTYSPPKQCSRFHLRDLRKTIARFCVAKAEAPPAGRAAFVAAFFVMAPFITGCIVPAMAGDPARPAGTQGRLEAEYTASISGIPIGQGNWVIEISDDQYTAPASGTTTGMLRFFTGARGTGAAHGTVSGGQPDADELRRRRLSMTARSTTCAWRSLAAM